VNGRSPPNLGPDPTTASPVARPTQPRPCVLPGQFFGALKELVDQFFRPKIWSTGFLAKGSFRAGVTGRLK
jgi:hypothetical protein